MIVFRYNIPDVSRFHQLVADMGLPGTCVQVDDPKVNETDDGGFKVVLHEGPFIGVLVEDSEGNHIELYPMKNTNSVNYFKNRYPKMRWDDVRKFKTKRW